jgi:hypothetical protein
VQRILEGRRLKPWRVHYWLTPKAALDETFRGTVLSILELYTRPLDPHERVLSLDEKTLQPRFIDEWNAHAHPFRWTARSFDKIIAKIDAAVALAA